MWIERGRRVALGIWIGCVVAACKDTTAEKLLAARLAEGCAINSDCLDPYVCVFERCHVACTEDRDCEADQRCVLGTERINVCQLPDEIACETRDDCPGEQVCAEDLECRDFCAADSDCSNREQVCASGGVCASTISEKDDPSVAGLGETSSANDGGDGQGSMDGGESAAAGDSGSSGSTPDLTGSTTVEVDATGEAASTSGGDSEVPYVEPIDGTELIENDVRETPIPLPEQASIFLPEGDEDWFSVTAPDDGRAHIIHLTIAQETGVRATLDAMTQDSFSPVGSLGNGLLPGVTESVFISMGPGSTMLLRFFVRTSGGFGRLDVSFELLDEDDPYEPNNDEDQARTIPLDTDISAQLIEPYTSATDHPIDDWYQVDLEAGEGTFNLLENPDSGRMSVQLVTLLGVSDSIAAPLEGVRGPFPFTIEEQGTYLIHVTRQASAAGGYAPFASGAVPAHVAEPYVFRVEQAAASNL